MVQVLTPDICVIGAGCGGIAAAAAAAAFGVPVVLVEKGEMGGTYLNSGGLPSKALLASARTAEAIRQMKTFGLNVPKPKIDFYQIHDHIRGVIDAAAPNYSAERLTGLGVQVIRGTGRFKDAGTLAVGDDTEIKARRFIIATGSSPAIPTIPGIEETPYLTNETLFDLLACPRHLVVIGATSTGLAFAQAFGRLGAEVTLLNAGQPLAEDDPECTAIVLNQLEREGITVKTGVTISRIKAARSKVNIFIGGAAGEEKIEASHLLVAAGRAPNTVELNLDAAGIKHDPDWIEVDTRLRTTNKKIYAIGDVVGGQFAHVAVKHAELVIRDALFRQRAKVRSNEIPRVAYTVPELAHVGLTEAEARQARYDFRILRSSYRENDRARAERQASGHIKVITTKRGKILGATIVGAEAGELISPWTLAISQGMNVRAFADLAVPYPTFSEIGRQAAISYFAPSLARPWIRRIISIVRLLR